MYSKLVGWWGKWISKVIRSRPHPTSKVRDTSYWYVGSPIWNAYFQKVIYNTGDEVWISRQTGRVYCGRTHDGWLWENPQTPIHK